MFIVFRTLHLSLRLSCDRLKQFGGTIVWLEEIIFPSLVCADVQMRGSSFESEGQDRKQESLIC